MWRYLQYPVFREVCTVDGVLHLVFAKLGSQGGRAEVAGDFLFKTQFHTTFQCAHNSNTGKWEQRGARTWTVKKAR